MLYKTKAIVLHQIRYSDSGIIVYLYTRDFGRQTILIKGMRKKKSGRHNVFFQPMFILDMELYYKEGRGMQSLRDFSVSFAPSHIHEDVKKASIAMFLGEFLYSVLREETPNTTLFDFIAQSIMFFDGEQKGFPNFHIAFLCSLSGFLGFEPSGRNDEAEKYFDLSEGRFTIVPPFHGDYANEEVSGKLAEFFSSSFQNIEKIALTGSLRNDILETLMKYYSIHLPGIRNFKSLEILREVFR
jgi:DNA repair protein RecO (recombination protein O)